jgi:hypothetical protein
MNTNARIVKINLNNSIKQAVIPSPNVQNAVPQIPKNCCLFPEWYGQKIIPIPDIIPAAEDLKNALPLPVPMAGTAAGTEILTDYILFLVQKNQ